MNRWEQGRAEIAAFLTEGRLTPIAANRELADQYLATARVRLTAAEAITMIDPEGAFALTYDADRPTATVDDLNQALPAAAAIIERAAAIIPGMPAF